MLFILWYDYTPNLYFWQVIKHNFVCLHHFSGKAKVMKVYYRQIKIV